MNAVVATKKSEYCIVLSRLLKAHLMLHGFIGFTLINYDDMNALAGCVAFLLVLLVLSLLINYKITIYFPAKLYT